MYSFPSIDFGIFIYLLKITAECLNGISVDWANQFLGLGAIWQKLEI